MKKTTIATIMVLLLAGVGTYLFLADPLGLSPGRGKVSELTEFFMQDLQFKDFRQAGLYHHELERDRLDIGNALESLFMVKPEFLDIRDYKIVRADVDESGRRAKVLVRTRYKVLNKDKEPGEKDVLVYWIKRHPDCPSGATCPAGECVDEFGEVINKRDEAKRKNKTVRPGDVPEEELSDETFSCDAAEQERWFMNLDSTLRSKHYK